MKSIKSLHKEQHLIFQTDYFVCFVHDKIETIINVLHTGLLSYNNKCKITFKIHLLKRPIKVCGQDFIQGYIY